MKPLPDADTLLHVVYHVFLPPKIPQEALGKSLRSQVDQQLVHLTLEAIERYRKLTSQDIATWNNMHRMLSRVAQNTRTPVVKDRLAQDLASMDAGDVLALHIREQNAAVLIRKNSTDAVFEIFEVQPPNKAVMSVPGKLVRRFPGPAIRIPNSAFDDPGFIQETSNFLVQMSNDILEGSTAKTIKAGSTVSEVRDSADPHYISELFVAILHGVGKEFEPTRVIKRVADEVLWNDAYTPWRRSPLWLIIRVALQTSLASTSEYKHFMTFLHAHILHLCYNNPAFSDDLLFVMRAKLARRLLKTQDSAPEFLVNTVNDIATRTEQSLQARWTRIRTMTPKLAPLRLDPESALIQSLPNTRQYFQKTMRVGPDIQQPPFVPHQIPRLLGRSNFTSFDGDALRDASVADQHIALFDFENAVFEDLTAWVGLNRRNESACAFISSCLEEYISVADSLYVHDVADRSIMMLTIMALWVALDRLTTTRHALLLDYSPEIPENLIDVLLLRSSQHLDQARDIQLYLRRRHADSKAAARGSIFGERITSDSFAVRFFDQSPSLQALMQEIEEDAQRHREQKLEELGDMNRRYVRLQQRIRALDCECPITTGGYQHIQDRCERCRTEVVADRMQIKVHEWPLPSNQLAAKMVVFEIGCPEVVKIWRLATYRILCDLGGSSRDTCVTKHHRILADYAGLTRWTSQLGGSVDRVTIASSTKSFLHSHYSRTQIPASENSVCVRNGLTFELFDSEQAVWATGPFIDASFAQYGTFSLPDGSPYQYLRHSLEWTSHTSNQIIASQSDCPQGISLHEHYAFGTLRSGPRLQWMNIARGLEETCLSFNRTEVDLLHTQAAWQIGPLSQNDKSREWHLELNDPQYGRRLVAQAQRLLDRVKGSWLESTSVRTIVTLVSRLLASTTDVATHHDAYQFLREARTVTFGWLGELSNKLQRAELGPRVSEYQQRICEMAAICRSTCNVDIPHLSKLLTTTEEWNILVFCSVTLYDNQDFELNDIPSSLRVLICRDRRFTHKLAPVIVDYLNRMPRLLDEGISQHWGNYQPGPSGWATISAHNSPWVSTTTSGTSGRRTQQVHLNLFEGRLLVDGRPLGRLPREYTSHPTYVRLFGQKVLEVTPSGSPATQFTARMLLKGNEVSFNLDHDTGDLVVHARKGDITLELIAHTRLRDDFPLPFSSEYHHWINRKTRTIEFRPVAVPWTSRTTNWRIRPISASNYTMERRIGDQTISLIDVHSPTFRSIAGQLAPLEDARYIYATLSRSAAQKIFVKLPRMKLIFIINENLQLESENFRNLVVDESQTTGTMFGLHNQLVLRDKDPVGQSLPQSRTVLIPYGAVKFATRGGQVHVTIDPGSEQHVVFYRYKVDSDLGYLAGSVNLTSRLFKIYLHALTSHCLPDPLTGRTGTEEALHELSEPATSSFEHIDVEQARLLQLIAQLTPRREYYPDHLQSMMTTHWLDLSPLAQHHAFSITTNSIIQRALSLQLFNSSGFDLESHMVEHNEILLTRTAQRTRIYYPADTTIRLPTIPGGAGGDSQIYEARDSRSDVWAERGQIASWVSHLVHEKWNEPIYLLQCHLLALAERWDLVHGPSQQLGLAYSADWLRLELPPSWISLYNLCRQPGPSRNQFSLCSCLAASAYSGKLSYEVPCAVPDREPHNIVTVLVAFATNPLFSSLEPPVHSSYKLSDGYVPTSGRVRTIILSAIRDIEDTPAHRISRNEGESIVGWIGRQQTHYKENVSALLPELAKTLLSRWLNRPWVSSAACSVWFDVESALDKARLYFESCSKNKAFRAHVEKVEAVLRPAKAELEFRPTPLRPPKPKPKLALPTHLCDPVPHLEGLMKRRACPKSSNTLPQSIFSTRMENGPPADTTRLEKLLANFQATSTHPLRRKYGVDLEASRVDLAKVATPIAPSQLPSLHDLQQNRHRCHDDLQKILEAIRVSLCPCTAVEVVAFTAGIWPRLGPRALLGRLALWSRANIPPPWHSVLVGYARTYIEYQRSQRLINLATENKREEFYKELDSTAAESGTISDHPDWLLVQIDGNFSVRTIQTQVASEMISPSSAANTILQLNMGEGKSSVIVPIIAATLANSNQLVRVVVLKPLWRQMFHLLVSRLAGLANRRIYYLPFGRHIRVDNESCKQVQGLYSECMREGGILLVQPEHVLSFKLMGIDQLISTTQQTAATKRLQSMQQWLSENSRDILDECDEILHVRYQLIYTTGEQQPLEGHPDRWTTTQQVLSLVALHINRLKLQGSDKLKHDARPGGQFPFIRILPESDEVISELIQLVARDAIAGHIPNMNFGLLPSKTCENVLSLLTERDLPQNRFELLKQFEPSMQNGLLLLRGLFACGILVFALRDKHYRVDYGLDLSRSLLAVPYHAKDMPSLRAEFGHPDVTVVLTCLSYYYHGLAGGQLGTCFEFLYKLDNPTLEYEHWVRANEEIPPELQQLEGVNIKDREQFVTKLLPAFARNVAVIDFFLASVVFPKSAKQFRHKLSTSGWDLVEAKHHITTGFSGTNDNRHLLPTSISQSDPVKQSSTNALVLTYLLQPENNHYFCIRSAKGETCSTTEFLDRLVTQDPEIRVLLDVGAQMLDLQNHELVKYWLGLRPDVAAAVYFNNKDELVIMPQNGSSVSFFASPFAQQLDKCIVYLDDGHTRGTDLDLPRHTRAAVTLGPKVTKDRLLQGCMRMRRLGHGQSVVFSAPPEVDSQIRKISGLSPNEQVNTQDVLRWAIIETCKDLEHHVSHWAHQGVEYDRRKAAPKVVNTKNAIKSLKEHWMTPESRSLQDMYGASSSRTSLSECPSNAAFNIPSLRKRLESLGVHKILEDPSIGEEQEREVSHEFERERQVERPVKSKPAPHVVSEDIRYFVRTGTVPRGSTGIVSLFRPIRSAGVSKRGTWSSKLLASVDFLTTLSTSAINQPSDYMRPLHWLLSGSNGVLLALSPCEINELIPDIRDSTAARLHIYTPRVARSMVSFSDLGFYTIPPLPDPNFVPLDPMSRVQLDLFAGQLYLESYSQYCSLCAFLGIYLDNNTEHGQGEINVQSDGFVAAPDRQRLGNHRAEYLQCGFSRSPIGGLKDFIAYRRKGMDYLRTHVGQILHGRQLTPDSF